MDFSSIDNTKNHVAASTCFEWLLKYVNVFIILAPKLTLHHFSEFQHKKMNFKSWQVCDWLAKWLTGVLGFMDLRWPWVYRRSNVGLVLKMSGLIQQGRVLYSVCLDRIQKEHLVDIFELWLFSISLSPSFVWAYFSRRKSKPCAAGYCSTKKICISNHWDLSS